MNIISQKSIKTINLNNKPTLILTNQLLAQITQAHYFAGKTEWSGLVLYTEKQGSIEDPDNLVLECSYLYPMNVGDETFTESLIKESLIELNKDFDDCIEYKHMFLHTHHGMTTFFSDKDTDTLYEQVDKFYYFVSLIVNYEGKYVAKIVMLGKEKGGELFTKGNHRFKFNQSEDQEVMYMMDCKIEFEKLLYDTGKSFQERMEDLKKIKESKTVNTINHGDFNTIVDRDRFGKYNNPISQNKQLSLIQDEDWNTSYSHLDINNNRFKSIPDTEYNNFLVKWINHDLLAEGLLGLTLRKYENSFIVGNAYEFELSEKHLDLISSHFWDFAKSYFDETYLTQKEKEIILKKVSKVLTEYKQEFNLVDELENILIELEMELEESNYYAK